MSALVHEALFFVDVLLLFVHTFEAFLHPFTDFCCIRVGKSSSFRTKVLKISVWEEKIQTKTCGECFNFFFFFFLLKTVEGCLGSKRTALEILNHPSLTSAIHQQFWIKLFIQPNKSDKERCYQITCNFLNAQLSDSLRAAFS